MTLKNSENNGREEIGLVTPTPELERMYEAPKPVKYTWRLALL